jgi:hypothetical protein
VIPKSYRNIALVLPLLLVLMQVGFAHHFHCANSYHDEKDCFHSPCAYTKIDYTPLTVADISTPFSHSPDIREGELIQVDSPGVSPFISVSISRSRAPPV